MARKTASTAGPARRASAAGKISADSSAAQAEKTAPYFKKLMDDMHMHGGMDSVREADYNGHHIVVRTAYTITIDGKPFDAGLDVTNGGHVHYHGMPNVGFASAIDLMKTVIDTFPDDFGPGAGAQQPQSHDHAHGGLPMDKASRTRKRRKRAVKPRRLRRR